MVSSPADVRFTSSLPAAQRAQLETLLYFNHNQGRYRDVVIDSIEQFGEPRIVESDRFLRVHTTLLGQVQTLSP